MTRPAALLLPLALVLGLACGDTGVDPFDNDGRYFTVYGYLDVLETEHAVRVVPVTRIPQRITDPLDPEAALDAVVTSTDLTTGEVIRWRHTLERLADGTYGHVFRAAFLVQPGRRYRLEVARSDGKTASAETDVPIIGDAAHFDLAPVEFSPDSTVVTQEVYMPGVASPWRIEAVYLLTNQVRDEGTLNGRFFVPYGRAGERTADGGWRLQLTISEDQIPVREELAEFRRQGVYDSTAAVILESMGVQIRMLDANWDPPEGIFDPEVLAQPGAFSNVE
ncbi:MAG: hypothetical protein R3247_07545, partial [Rhodothermales bacterium]|nr:hypothetical protein [Rhodothermales bacterium]